MLTITIPPEIAVPLADAARRLGTTPELLAIEGVRRVLPPVPQAANGPGTLREFLGDLVGTVDGSHEAYSQDCGRKFADGLAAERAAPP